jgi:hypothetical protein
MARAALFVAALLAVVLARRVPSSRQRVIAGTLAGLAALDVCRPALPWLTLRTALFAGWYAATAWCVWAVLRKDEAPSPSSASGPDDTKLGANGILILLSPAALVLCAAVAVELRLTMPLAGAAFTLALVVQLVASTRCVLAGRWPARDDRAAWLSAWVLVCSSIADLAGSWLLAQPARDWYISRWISLATWLVVGGVHLWMLLGKRTESPPR